MISSILKYSLILSQDQNHIIMKLLLQDGVVRHETRMADLVSEYPALLMLLEHLDSGFLLHDDTIAQYAETHQINIPLFMVLIRLYMGQKPDHVPKINPMDLPRIVMFLKRCHQYYKEEKYPEINQLIRALYEVNHSPEIKMIDRFFNDYFEEVLEHLHYEDDVVFPYILKLIGEDGSPNKADAEFSVREYRDHHSDIESKLSDLKALLLKHVEVRNDRIIRRKLLLKLAELEVDLTIHSLIEENMLIPAVEQIEQGNS
jgi:regulator of cell morphogenesis and NO signaling